MPNWPSENFSTPNKNPEKGGQLPKMQRNLLEKAKNILKSNPEVEESVLQILERNLIETLKNPENFKKLLEFIDQNMRKQIQEIAAQVEDGKIYANEGENFAKEAIIAATQIKMKAIEKAQEIQEA